MSKKSWSFILFFALILAGTMVSFHRFNGDGSLPLALASPSVLYHCPMHPNYTSDKPGDCPVCGMKLVPVADDDPLDPPKASGDASRQGKRKILYYRAPMQPQVTSPVPMKDEMGMDYIPVYEGKETSEPIKVKGHASFKVSPEKEQLIGVKTGLVEYRNLVKVVRASARVAYDTELYNAIAEYKASLSAREKIKDSPWPDVHERADALVNAAALRLRQLGVSEEQVNNIHGEYQNPTNLLLGQKGGSVWVYAQIYEYEAGLVQPGQTMVVTAPALPGKSFEGKIRSVDPILNSETRSLRVRAELPNPDGLLKPEMYVNAKIVVELGRKLAVPEDAVLDTGERQIVFVVSGGGKYAPRDVRLGQEAEGYYEVISGVSRGEKVVTSANFLIDSESRLKAAAQGSGGR